MKKRLINKPMFEQLVSFILAVWSTLNPADFPNKTLQELDNLEKYLAKTFTREAVIPGSDEYGAAYALLEGLRENCLENPLFTGKDFVEARKTFRNEIFLFTQRLLEIENHPAHKWTSFITLRELAPEWEK